jgi:Mg2+ and Co2+ transporter CorA
MADNQIYSKLLDILIVIKQDADHFKPYSAQNLTKMIDASIHNKRREPEGIQRLYSLEKRITEVRELLAEQKTIAREAQDSTS